MLIHSLTNDQSSEECDAFLAQVAAGTIRVRVEPVVVHELTYALPRYFKQFNRMHVATTIESLLTMRGIDGDTDVMIEALHRWAFTPGLGFVDAYLATRSIREGCPVYSKN
ncbi:MAG: hypothetical protein IT336_08310, partial [Thermomicrobiales bacterium]|nr:hypothetical protein [Thermomicrobiales bacterium]